MLNSFCEEITYYDEGFREKMNSIPCGHFMSVTVNVCANVIGETWTCIQNDSSNLHIRSSPLRSNISCLIKMHCGSKFYKF